MSQRKIKFIQGGRFIKHIHRDSAKNSIINLLHQSGRKIQRIDFIFVNDSELLEINQKFLNHNFYTDIITFDLTETGQSIEAEIYVSTDRVTENAKNVSASIESEIVRVLHHGVLHLIGFKDKSKKEKETMAKEEDKCIENYYVLKTFHVKQDAI